METRRELLHQPDKNKPDKEDYARPKSKPRGKRVVLGTRLVPDIAPLFAKEEA
jgi:hypothetical protein